MKAFLFPGQGAQFVGMSQKLIEQHPAAKTYFEQANDILQFDIEKVMAEGSEEDLRQTKITQPAIFLHSVITAKVKMDSNTPPVAVAGHSLGEFSALVASQVLSFEAGLQLVYQRALAMQEACENQAGTMAAIMTNDMAMVEEVCASIDEVVIPANYNTASQLVISGSIEGVAAASKQLSENGAKAIPLAVGGAFHSPLMDSAKQKLQQAIEQTEFARPICPIYQNVTALPTQDVLEIRKNLINQLTGAVRWSQTIQNMIGNDIKHFVEVGGRGRILLGMIRKIDRSVGMEVL
jgi:[acyl-carrier-protein] S-malonyltransferase